MIRHFQPHPHDFAYGSYDVIKSACLGCIVPEHGGCRDSLIPDQQGDMTFQHLRKPGDQRRA